MKPRLIFIPVILFYFFNQVTAQTIYTDVLVIGALIGVLEPAPAADVRNSDKSFTNIIKQKTWQPAG